MNSFETASTIQNLATQFESLAKATPAQIRQSTQYLRQRMGSSKQGFDPKHAQTLLDAIYKDQGTGHIMGNQMAYKDFVEGLRQRKASGKKDPGIHIRMDANDFKSINSMHGYHVGDKAIATMGKTIRKVADKVFPGWDASTQSGGTKLFRLGGDEFHLYAPDHESAALFVRTLRGHLSRLAPLKGTHNWSMSYGLGSSPRQADKALEQAKEPKRAARHPLGQAPHYAHSLVPGHQGPIPLDEPMTRFKLAP